MEARLSDNEGENQTVPGEGSCIEKAERNGEPGSSPGTPVSRKMMEGNVRFWEADLLNPNCKIFFFLLFICAYNVWVISPPSPLPPPSLPPLLPPSNPYSLATRQKLFCPYL
jgi:hypothetical protein